MNSIVIMYYGWPQVCFPESPNYCLPVLFLSAHNFAQPGDLHIFLQMRPSLKLSRDVWNSKYNSLLVCKFFKGCYDWQKSSCLVSGRWRLCKCIIFAILTLITCKFFLCLTWFFILTKTCLCVGPHRCVTVGYSFWNKTGKCYGSLQEIEVTHTVFNNRFFREHFQSSVNWSVTQWLGVL